MKITKENEIKIEKLLSEMTLEEKVSMCHANSKFASNGVERLNISELTMMDGPHGVRSDVERDSWRCLNREEDKCTYLPTETALAATFDPKLARKFGETLGAEARYRGKDIILGPGVNIIRTPLCGRNFEYMSEDPCVIEKMAPELVKGIESQDTAACVKHYCLNNQEYDRGRVNVEVSDRALHEIYLRGFYAAVIGGGASSVMGAYNRYKNEHMCHNSYLVKDLLKGKWGFRGVYLSDWAGAHDTDECIKNGLDIEMGTNKPYNEYYMADAMLEKAKNSAEVRAEIDDKVRRILRLMLSVGKLSENRKKGEYNSEKHHQTAYDIAADGMVLLKNTDNILPLKEEKLKNILVVGKNAAAKHSEGGSSSGVRALYEVTPLEGIKNRLSDKCVIDYESGVFDLKYNSIPMQNLNITDLKSGCRNYRLITNIKDENGSITSNETLSDKADIIGGTAYSYDIYFSVCIPESGGYTFRAASNGTVNVSINGLQRIKLHEVGLNLEGTVSYEFEKGDNLDFEIHIDSSKRDETTDFTFGWITPLDHMLCSSEKQLIEKAKKADYVIYCGGLDHSYDTESIDKRSMRLTNGQDVIIPKLLNANPNTVVVITAGSPVEMPWIDSAKAVLWTWYAGMEGGNALADILIGKVSPSGKMPFTLPRRYEDTPVARYGEYKAENCKYNEDILVGYRGFEYDGIEPMFPFGHGLSYSRFEYSDLKLTANENGVNVEFTVKNTGNLKAAETAQIYVSDPVCSVKRPKKELKAFEKVRLSPGESAKINVLLTDADFSFYDEKSNGWKLESGDFNIYAGASSGDIRLSGSISK